MGQARDVMDRLTAAFSVAKDPKAAAECYAYDAVMVTPDQGEVSGREQVIDYMRVFLDAFPDLRYEAVNAYESGNTAIDEGYVVGTNTGPLPLPSGELLPATGRRVGIRSCDIATVEGGHVVRHHLYFDQMEFLSQLGLVPEEGP